MMAGVLAASMVSGPLGVWMSMLSLEIWVLARSLVDNEASSNSVYAPFTNSDLGTGNPRIFLFWRGLRTPCNLVGSIFFSYQPTWVDYRQLLCIIFIVKERDLIIRVGRKAAMGPGATGLDAAMKTNTVFSPTRLGPHTDQGRAP